MCAELSAEICAEKHDTCLITGITHLIFQIEIEHFLNKFFSESKRVVDHRQLRQFDAQQRQSRVTQSAQFRTVPTKQQMKGFKVTQFFIVRDVIGICDVIKLAEGEVGLKIDAS